MSNISALIKVCKIKKLPQEVEDLIFSFLELGFYGWYKSKFKFKHNEIPHLYINSLMSSKSFNLVKYHNNDILKFLLNKLSEERDIMGDYSKYDQEFINAPFYRWVANNKDKNYKSYLNQFKHGEDHEPYRNFIYRHEKFIVRIKCNINLPNNAWDLCIEEPNILIRHFRDFTIKFL